MAGMTRRVGAQRLVLVALVGSVFSLGVMAPSAYADTLVVTVMDGSNSDDGECSVREAVLATNSNLPVNGANDCDHSGSTGKDRVELPTGTAPISGAAGDNLNGSGDLDVEAGNGLTIVGEGASQSKLDGDVDRVIDQISGPLTLRKLTVQDGDAGANSGGDVLDRADALLTLERVTIRDGEADLGGGVRVEPGGELVMDHSVVTNNTADGSQGGGGIHAGTPVTIIDSTVSNNSATGSFGPGGMRIEGGPSTISGSTFSGNSTAQGAGGAIEVTSLSMTERDLTITDSVITANHADGYRGGGIEYEGQGTLKITRSLFTLNTAKSGGGAIETQNDPDTLKLSRSVVSNNTLSSTSNEIIGGAGISADGTSRISLSMIAGNVADSPNAMAFSFGGAIRNGGDMRISRSTLEQNQSARGNGGGISQDGAGSALTLSNTTFRLNTASTTGGAIHSNLGADAGVFNSTFAENFASGDGDAIYAEGAGVFDVKGSIFAEGPTACSSSILVSKGYNVDADETCAVGGPHDATMVDPKLGQFDVYGGPIAGADGIATQLILFAVKKSSPAVNRIPKRKCKDDMGRLKTDERGAKRPGGKRCDAGAFEA
jgi:predicted outer membrane repeat protein